MRKPRRIQQFQQNPLSYGETYVKPKIISVLKGSDDGVEHLELLGFLDFVHSPVLQKH
jgi:hypothetical protein